MARKNEPAQQPDGGMPLDENRMMQAAQLAAMMAQGMQQTRQPAQMPMGIQLLPAQPEGAMPGRKTTPQSLPRLRQSLPHQHDRARKKASN